MDLTPCPVCTRKWGKALVESCCHCSGHVPITYRGPDPLEPRPQYPIERRVLSLSRAETKKRKK